MNRILRLIFEQWQEDRLDGNAETLAYNCFDRNKALTVAEKNALGDCLCNAINEVAERAFLVGFRTACGLKDLLDGKNIDDDKE